MNSPPSSIVTIPKVKCQCSVTVPTEFESYKEAKVVRVNILLLLNLSTKETGCGDVGGSGVPAGPRAAFVPGGQRGAGVVDVEAAAHHVRQLPRAADGARAGGRRAVLRPLRTALPVPAVRGGKLIFDPFM